jgi:hypothetical protein
MKEKDFILKFERDIDPDLRHIPMLVRMKLDLCGVRIELKSWQALSDADRALLIEQQADTRREVADYITSLQRLCGQYALHSMSAEGLNARKAWLTARPVPPPVSAMLARVGSDLDWSALGTFERYVLTHLARGDAFEKFSSAVVEFGGD